MEHAVATYRAEIERRTIKPQNGPTLTIPAWVRKDPELLQRVHSRGFKTQLGLDLFLAGVAESRHRKPVAFAGRRAPMMECVIRNKGGKGRPRKVELDRAANDELART